jgi:hypothetical protein
MSPFKKKKKSYNRGESSVMVGLRNQKNNSYGISKVCSMYLLFLE